MARGSATTIPVHRDVLLPARHVGLVLLWTLAALLAATAVGFYVLGPAPLGIDAHAYWLAARTWTPYGRPAGSVDAFLYSPLVVQLLHSVAWVSWPAFLAAWMTLEAGVLGWLVRPAGWRLAVPLWLLCVPEILLGNIVGLLCLMVVVGMRRPGWWAFAWLTKVSPGGLGVLWFAARGQWTAVARVVAWTLLLAGVSFALSPGLWVEWVAFLGRQQAGSAGSLLLARTAAAAVLVVAAARLDRPALLPVALLLSTPVLSHVQGLAYLAAVPMLLQAGRRSATSRSEPVGDAVGA